MIFFLLFKNLNLFNPLVFDINDSVSFRKFTEFYFVFYFSVKKSTEDKKKTLNDKDEENDEVEEVIQEETAKTSDSLEGVEEAEEEMEDKIADEDVNAKKVVVVNQMPNNDESWTNADTATATIDTESVPSGQSLSKEETDQQSNDNDPLDQDGNEQLLQEPLLSGRERKNSVIIYSRTDANTPSEGESLWTQVDEAAQSVDDSDEKMAGDDNVIKSPDIDDKLQPGSEKIESENILEAIPESIVEKDNVNEQNADQPASEERTEGQIDEQKEGQVENVEQIDRNEENVEPSADQNEDLNGGQEQEQKEIQSEEQNVNDGEEQEQNVVQEKEDNFDVEEKQDQKENDDQLQEDNQDRSDQQEQSVEPDVEQNLNETEELNQQQSLNRNEEQTPNVDAKLDESADKIDDLKEENNDLDSNENLPTIQRPDSFKSIKTELTGESVLESGAEISEKPEPELLEEKSRKESLDGNNANTAIEENLPVQESINKDGTLEVETKSEQNETTKIESKEEIVIDPTETKTEAELLTTENIDKSLSESEVKELEEKESKEMDNSESKMPLTDNTIEKELESEDGKSKFDQKIVNLN